MFEQEFKKYRRHFHKDSGGSSELDYTEQSSWTTPGEAVIFKGETEVGRVYKEIDFNHLT
jgi:hypothetical protein